jgi:hypothetical protein
MQDDEHAQEGPHSYIKDDFKGETSLLLPSYAIAPPFLAMQTQLQTQLRQPPNAFAQLHPPPSSL